MLSVGLTGGIASGKTMISNLFTEQGVAVVDTDVISRNLLEPGEATYVQVRDHFGDVILGNDERIDRVKLRTIVFSDAGEKSWLEKMLHPLVYQRSHQAIGQIKKAPYVLVVVPLLFEKNFQSLADRILVVDCPRQVQIERLCTRDGIDEALAQKMLDAQMTNQERLSRAHDIIHNRSNDVDLAEQVLALHKTYLALANPAS